MVIDNVPAQGIDSFLGVPKVHNYEPTADTSHILNFGVTDTWIPIGLGFYSGSTTHAGGQILMFRTPTETDENRSYFYHTEVAAGKQYYFWAIPEIVHFLGGSWWVDVPTGVSTDADYTAYYRVVTG